MVKGHGIHSIHDSTITLGILTTIRARPRSSTWTVQIKYFLSTSQHKHASKIRCVFGSSRFDPHYSRLSRPTHFVRESSSTTMPPPSQKGTGKKGNGARQSRSRNTTPSLAGRNSVPPTESGDTALLELPLSNFRTADDLFEIYHHHAIPSARDLDALVERIKNLQKIVDVRGDICDKGMRLLAKARKERFEDIENERRDEERKERVKKEAIEEEERKANKKKRKEQQAATKEEQRPLTHGAHGLAPQDGSKLGVLQ